MTISEIIESLEEQAQEKDCLAECDTESIFTEDAAVLREAAKLLRKQMPPNAPLTLEQLREMVGEPVWIEFLHKTKKSRYRIVRALSDIAIVFQEYNKEFGPYDSLFLGYYGKTWLAYRRKPEEWKT